MVTRKKKITEPTVWPKIVKGSHLTVITYEDGTTEMEWDNDALDRDVQAAIAGYSAQSENAIKKPRKKKQG
jgi:hypothetical protein